MHRPWRSSSNAADGFEITLFKTDEYWYYGCHSFGFRVHPIDQIINTDEKTVFTSLRYDLSVDVLITPEVVRADESLRNVKPENRRCFYEDEGNLKYFKKYSRKNCEIECVSDVAYKNCGCVPFNYIRNKTMKICNLFWWNCVLLHQVVLYNESQQAQEGCNCLESCESTTYHLEVIQTQMKPNFTKKYQFAFNLSGNLCCYFQLNGFCDDFIQVQAQHIHSDDKIPAI